MEAVLDNNYQLFIETLDPDVVCPRLKMPLNVANSDRYYNIVQNPEKTRIERNEELMRIVRHNHNGLWLHFARVCDECGYQDLARILKDGISEETKRHPDLQDKNHQPKIPLAVKLPFIGSKDNFVDVLNHHYPELLELIDPDIVVPHLKKCLTVGGSQRYFEKVSKPKIRQDRNEELLKIIIQREEIWDPFLDACRVCGYKQILEMFKEVQFGKERIKGKRRRRRGNPPSSLKSRPKVETSSLSSDEDVQTMRGAGASGSIPRTLGTRHKLGSETIYERLPWTGQEGDQVLLNVKGASGDVSGFKNSDKEDNHQQDNTYGVREGGPETMTGNIDNSNKPGPVSKEIPVRREEGNLPVLQELMSSTDSSHPQGGQSVKPAEADTDQDIGPRTNHLYDNSSTGSIYCRTLPSSMLKDSPPRKRTDQDLQYGHSGYRFPASEASEPPSDHERLMEETLNEREDNHGDMGRLQPNSESMFPQDYDLTREKKCSPSAQVNSNEEKERPFSGEEKQTDPSVKEVGEENDDQENQEERDEAHETEEQVAVDEQRGLWISPGVLRDIANTSRRLLHSAPFLIEIYACTDVSRAYSLLSVKHE